MPSGGAVPNEVRDASLTLGRTKRGADRQDNKKDARQDKVGGLEIPWYAWGKHSLRCSHHFLFGFRMSCKASESKVKANTVNRMAKPGNKDSHQATSNVSFPSISMLPQEGVGG
jgi:hypothetical protein